MQKEKLLEELHKRAFYSALQEYVNDLDANKSFEVFEDIVTHGAAVVHFSLNEYGKLEARKVEHIEEHEKEIPDSEKDYSLGEVTLKSKKKPK